MQRTLGACEMTHKRNTKTKWLAAGPKYSPLESRRFLSANTILIELPEALASHCEPEIVSHKDMTTVMEQPFAGHIDSFFEFGAPTAVNDYLPVGGFGFASLHPDENLIVDTFFETSANDFWQFDRNEMSFNVESFRQFEDVIFETASATATFARPADQAFETSFAPTQSPTVTPDHLERPAQLASQFSAQTSHAQALGERLNEPEIRNTRLESMASIMAEPQEVGFASNPASNAPRINHTGDAFNNQNSGDRSDSPSLSLDLNGVENLVFIANLDFRKTPILSSELVSETAHILTSTAFAIGEGQSASAAATLVVSVDFGSIYGGGDLQAIQPAKLLAFTSMSAIAPLDNAVELDGFGVDCASNELQWASERSMDAVQLSAVARILSLISDVDGDEKENQVGYVALRLSPLLVVGAAIGFRYIKKKRERKS